ncbi:MAG: type II toxin-antitoxin system VapC family toxin [Legionella sp.]|uniref:type II toxin-antitoxin system VapC family toxin n=1 Tax=Legionella sp. TaxID=459 RepID=UPI0039E4B629
MTNGVINRYMLDTNTVSHFIRGVNNVRNKGVSVPMSELAISAITEGELLLGLAKKPRAKQLSIVVHEFLIRVDVLPWDSAVAAYYGTLRADMQKKGKILGNLDLLIAAHALALGVVLITNDYAFTQVEGLKIEDWTQ